LGFEGESSVGLFPTHCKANHACTGSSDANAYVQALDRGGGIGVSLVAGRDIASGEEISFDYLGRGTGGEDGERRGALRAKYGFACRCGQCRAPAGDA